MARDKDPCDSHYTLREAEVSEMANGRFYSVSDTQEACALLSRYGEEANVLAGGTDLMVAVNQRQIPLQTLVFIGRAGLDYIRCEGSILTIGATTTHTEIAGSAIVREKAPLLSEAVRSIGSPAIRNMGTIGGNIANASPGADGSVSLLALGAKGKLLSVRGERLVDLDGFFLDVGKTVLEPDELLTEVIVPVQGGARKWTWHKLGQRKASVCAVISLAASLDLDGGTCRGVRIALGTVAPTPFLAREADALLEGQTLTPSRIEEAARAASAALPDRDGLRASVWYRRRICEVLIKRFFSDLLA
jgi:carbon-monoxide dehydrogenase medium subunit